MQETASARPDVRIPPIAGAFAPLRALARMAVATRRDLLHRMADAGLGCLLTEGFGVPPSFAEEVGAAGLWLGGGLSCFSDHAEAIRSPTETLRPIMANGQLRPRMEWYRGIVPTDRGYERALVEACVDAATRLPLRLFVLDFIRWPIHWEIELRRGATVREASFDPVTLRRFREESGVDIAVDDAATAAERIERSFLDEWTAFKCCVITEVVERIASAIRSVRRDLPLGAYIVPGDDDERRRYAGQDVSALSAHLDVLLPMTYHAILGRPPSWVGDVVAALRSRASIPIVPVVQVTADAAIAGSSDWGAAFPVREVGEAIDAGLTAGARGFVAFPAQALDEPRLAQLSAPASRLR